MNPYSAIRRGIAHWRMSAREKEHFAVDAVYGCMLSDYYDAVDDRAARVVLADILTGLAGCELAMSRTNRAMGWNPDPTPEEPEHAEAVRRSGLLVQEIAYCAAEGTAYRGVRCRELETEPATAALRALAVAYHSESAGHLGPTVGQRLSELYHAVVDVIGGSAAEVLVPLMIAHRYNPYACDCKRCGDPIAVHLGLPFAEQRRREAVTSGCDQP